MLADTGTLSGKHDSLREGARLGLVVATSIWIWLAVVDAVAGEPFRTFGGSLIGTAIAIVILARRHTLAAELRQAEEEENE